CTRVGGGEKDNNGGQNAETCRKVGGQACPPRGKNCCQSCCQGPSESPVQNRRQVSIENQGTGQTGGKGTCQVGCPEVTRHQGSRRQGRRSRAGQGGSDQGRNHFKSGQSGSEIGGQGRS